MFEYVKQCKRMSKAVKSLMFQYLLSWRISFTGATQKTEEPIGLEGYSQNFLQSIFQ